MMVCLVLSGCEQERPPIDNLVIDTPMPAITLTELDGTGTTLEAYRGRLVLINVWATWCKSCRWELPDLQALSDSLDPERFAVIGMAVDEDEYQLREFILDKNLTFTNYFDGKTRQAFDVMGLRLLPYTLLVAPDGKFLHRVPGSRDWGGEEVREALESAYNGDYQALRAL